MSAFVVSKEHIDYLIHAALIAGRRYPLGFAGKGFVNRETADDFGRELWAENIASVQYRYPDTTFGTMPGPNNLDHETLMLYRYQPAWARDFNPVAALKALDCYEYQSCEHPGWQTSDARAFCETLRRRLISHLPGYDDAPWEIIAKTRIAGAA